MKECKGKGKVINLMNVIPNSPKNVNLQTRSGKGKTKIEKQYPNPKVGINRFVIAKKALEDGTKEKATKTLPIGKPMIK